MAKKCFRYVIEKIVKKSINCLPKYKIHEFLVKNLKNFSCLPYKNSIKITSFLRSIKL